MFFKVLTTLILVCHAVRSEETEIMPDPQFLNYQALLKMPATFTTACTPAGVDIVFGIDGSASISPANFQAALQLIGKSVTQLDGLGLIGSDPSQTRIGTFQFGSEDYPSFPFLDTTAKLREQLKAVFQQDSSLSRVASAVNWVAKKDIYFGGAARPSVKKILVLLTDCLTNATPKEMDPAKALADSLGIEIFIVSPHPDVGLVCNDTFTGGNPAQHFLYAAFDDVTKITGCNPNATTSAPSASTTPPSDWYCVNGGIPGCHCKEGYTGPHCHPINYCKPPNRDVLYDGEIVPHEFCHGHGNCTYDNINGSQCDCHDDWIGPFCNQLNDTTTPLSRRCIAYVPDSKADQAALTTHYRCNLNYERCIPDNINCMFNMPISHDRYGKPYCPDDKMSVCENDSMCKCKDPIGWCIPLEPANSIAHKVSNAFNQGATKSSLLVLLSEFAS